MVDCRAWKKSSSVLSLHVGKDSIDLAVTSHPSSTADESLILPLPSIPLQCKVQDNQKVLHDTVLTELAGIVAQFDVCGMVVSWPLQKEGWCGAPCGRVLHTLDQMARDDADIMSAHRPVCLWDGHHFHSSEDEWGRTALYAHASKKEVHIASKEQYKDEGSLAAEIAHDYLRHHWPDLYEDEDKQHPSPHEKKRRHPSLHDQVQSLQQQVQYLQQCLSQHEQYSRRCHAQQQKINQDLMQYLRDMNRCWMRQETRHASDT